MGLAFFHSLLLDHRIRTAERREHLALARAGEALAAAMGPGADPRLATLLAAIAPLKRELEAYGTEMTRSLVADRTDYVLVLPWMRPLVVARGLCARAILRHLRHRCRARLRPLYAELGAAAETGGMHAPGDLIAVHAARTERAAAVAMRQEATPNVVAPAVARTVAGESVAFGKAFTKQLASVLFPKAPALAGLAAGWWVARNYTDSRWRSLLHSVGIGDGGTKVVSSDTLQAMHFWVPILAAAVCAYAGDRIARAFRRRYAPEDDECKSIKRAA
jgi:hypothetical protein